MTTNIKDYSTTQASNTSLNGIDVDEGMLPSNLNNAIRALMKNTREWFNDAQWIEYGDGDGAYTAAYGSATSFTIAGVNVTPIYHEGRRIKLTASTPGTIYGTISSSTFSTNTTINVTWDSGSLSNEAITNVYIGALSKTNNSLPTGVIATATLADGSVTTVKIAADAVNGSKIADDSIDSEHYVDASIDTQHIADLQITNAKLGADSVNGSKISDDSINSEHYVDGSIDTQHIANLQVTNAKLGADSVNGSKIADDSIDSEHYVDGSIDTAHLGNSQITTLKIADDNITTSKILNSNVTASKLATDSVVEVKIQNSAVTTNKINNDAVTIDKIADAVIVTNAEASSHTSNDTTFFTTSASDGLYFRQDSSETINSGQSWSSSDAFIATTAAIDARVTDLVDDVGGFFPISSETNFPNTNPDVNDGTGTIVSIKEMATTRTPSGGTVTISGGTVGGSTVTITGCGSTVLTASFGVLVETTTTLNTYTFHRLVPKATEVTTVAAISSDITTVAGDTTDIGVVSGLSSDIQALANIEDGTTATNAISNVGNNISSVVTTASNISGVNSFADRYRISSSAPTTSLDSGDLYFNTSTNVLNVYGASGWQNAGSSVNGTSQRYNYTATNAQTTFTGSDNAGNTLAYDAGYIDVYLNGVKLLNGTDVTVTSGSSVVLASGATTGDVVDIVAYGTFSVASLNADNLTSGTVPSARVSGAYNNVTSVGTLTSFASTGIDDNATGTSLTIASDGRTTLDATNEKPLVVHHSDGDTVRIGMNNNSTNSNEIAFESSDFIVKPGGFEKFRINGSGNVGIGDTSPDGSLHITRSGSSLQTVLERTTSNTGKFGIGINSGLVFNDLVTSTERMRIDSSGNVLVGTTSNAPAQNNVTGVSLRPTDASEFSQDGENVLSLNRKSNSGAVQVFRKDGTEFGRISVRSNTDMAIGSSDAAITFKSSDTIYPSNMTGEARDNAIDLGDTSTKFRNLYLGGGLYVGGTGTANKLEDYEEGSWTPAVTTGSISDSYGFYTKIGNTVHFTIVTGLYSDTSSSNGVELSLPFTSQSVNNKQTHITVMSRYLNISNKSVTAYINQNTNKLLFYINGNSSNAWVNLKHSDFSSTNAYLRATGFFYAD